MHTDEFNQIIENKIADIQKVLIKKAGEYAQDGDRLHNFKQAAHLQEVSLREALGGMMVKHTVSVYDMINTPEVDYPQELWEEKIGDHLNYLLLLLAVVWEEKNEKADEPLAEWEVQAAEGNIEEAVKAASDGPKAPQYPYRVNSGGMVHWGFDSLEDATKHFNLDLGYGSWSSVPAGTFKAIYVNNRYYVWKEND